MEKNKGVDQHLLFCEVDQHLLFCEVNLPCVALRRAEIKASSHCRGLSDRKPTTPTTIVFNDKAAKLKGKGRGGNSRANEHQQLRPTRTQIPSTAGLVSKDVTDGDMDGDGKCSELAFSNLGILV
ncbi:hypothetical protein EYF80_032724 [Liparis tanakae]|uniref:Uncharacterized protein n=1 Tax=Liparis tanakae TaxID=230148 RepID=A0A4Z2GUF1_9TELE|nr:hypothetical protein EYF80_032724 [Liparis tanakae]